MTVTSPARCTKGTCVWPKQTMSYGIRAKAVQTRATRMDVLVLAESRMGHEHAHAAEIELAHGRRTGEERQGLRGKRATALLEVVGIPSTEQHRLVVALDAMDAVIGQQRHGVGTELVLAHRVARTEDRVRRR